MGEGWLGELFLLRPNRFSPRRDALDVLTLGVLSFLCLPVGPVALLRAVRCADQHRAADARPPAAAFVGGALGLLGSALWIAVILRWVLSGS